MKKKIQDMDIEIVIGYLLRYGVISASVLVMAGGIVYLFRHGHQLPSYSEFLGEPDKMRKPVLIWAAVLRGEGRPLIQLGLLLLIATPIARIAVSVFGYLLERDWLYTMLTVVVLGVILWNLF